MILLGTLAFLAAVLTLAPLYVVLPMTKQSAALLDLSLSLRPVSPMACLLLAAAATAWFAIKWREWTGRLRTAGAALLVVALSGAALTRINIVERIFPPADGAVLASIAGFKDVADTDMVIGVKMGLETRAYPVRFLAHHHMWNDKLDGVPILPNY
ncbi:MAG: DUF3179 domain-containing protein [Bryobacterales bacterium]|nr:DUF3179 domain-containing protein [Bryobacterales bacterium]